MRYSPPLFAIAIALATTGCVDSRFSGTYEGAIAQSSAICSDGSTVQGTNTRGSITLITRDDGDVEVTSGSCPGIYGTPSGDTVTLEPHTCATQQVEGGTITTTYESGTLNLLDDGDTLELSVNVSFEIETTGGATVTCKPSQSGLLAWLED